jgi:hypothetical protein
MRNSLRPLCLFACCLFAGAGMTATFPSAPENTPPAVAREEQPPAPPEDPWAEATGRQGERYVYGMSLAGAYTYSPDAPWRPVPRVRRLHRSLLAQPAPIPPLTVRYAVISLAAPEKPEDAQRGAQPEQLAIFLDILHRGIDAPLDKEAREVLAALRSAYPLCSFRLDCTGEMTPDRSGVWSGTRRAPSADGAEILLAYDGAIFDAGKLDDGEEAVQTETMGYISRFANGGWHGTGSGGGGPLRVLGRTYGVCETGPGGTNWPNTHLFLVSFVPRQDPREPPRTPEAEYKPAGTYETLLRRAAGLPEWIVSGALHPLIPPPIPGATPHER